MGIKQKAMGSRRTAQVFWYLLVALTIFQLYSLVPPSFFASTPLLL
jgi:hypothetical protein